MSSTEFARWQAFELIEGPIGDRRTEAMLAIIGAHVANAVIAAAGGKDRIKPGDLIPNWDRAPKRPPSPEQIEAQLRALSERFKEV